MLLLKRISSLSRVIISGKLRIFRLLYACFGLHGRGSGAVKLLIGYQALTHFFTTFYESLMQQRVMNSKHSELQTVPFKLSDICVDRVRAKKYLLCTLQIRIIRNTVVPRDKSLVGCSSESLHFLENKNTPIARIKCKTLQCTVRASLE